MVVQAGAKGRRNNPRCHFTLHLASIACQLRLKISGPAGLHRHFLFGHRFYSICFGGLVVCGLNAAATAQQLPTLETGGTVTLANPLPAFEHLPSPAIAPFPPASHQFAHSAIDGRAIGGSAALHWGPAELLRARSRTLVQLYRNERDDARTAARILASFLQLQADHQQELGAASGMRAYYTRIALVEQLQLTEAALNRVDAEEVKQLALVEQGLPAGSDLSAFARQRIEIADQRLQLESQDLQLRNLLVQLTKINALCYGFQGERLDVQPQTLDCAGLKQMALAGRHDLRGWRLLAKSVDSASAPEFAKMIPTVVGGWSLPTPSIGSLKLLLCPPDTAGLAANMKRELELTVAQQVDWICQSVDQKCHQLELNYRRIELAEQTVAGWRARRAQLVQLQAAGGGQPEQFAAAQAELLKAQAAAVSRRLEGRLAEIDLAEATGGLAERCRSGAAWLSTGH